jgi:hypothetical protein
MPVLDKEKYFNRLHERIGTDTSDDAISFLEDMTDTFNDLERRANGDGENWEKKYHELDEAWKAKYRHRFMNSDGGYAPPMEDKKEEVKEVTFKDLFTDK